MKKQQGFFLTGFVFVALFCLLALFGGYLQNFSSSQDFQSIGLLDLLLNKGSILIFLTLAAIETVCLYKVYKSEDEKEEK